MDQTSEKQKLQAALLKTSTKAENWPSWKQILVKNGNFEKTSSSQKLKSSKSNSNSVVATQTFGSH
jgi:hypothetical protein